MPGTSFRGAPHRGEHCRKHEAWDSHTGRSSPAESSPTTSAGTAVACLEAAWNRSIGFVGCS